MALDRQKILGELGSVMKQLQNADCGCLGKLFGNSQQTGCPTMGNPLPTCGGCRRGCCHGHGCSQYNPSIPINQATPNINYMPTESPNPSQQPMTGNMYGYGPQIVNMMRGDHLRPQNVRGHAQDQPESQMQGQLTGPVVIDAPQSPHGKVGLTPFTPPLINQQGQFNPAYMNQGDVARQMQNQAMPNSNSNTDNATKFGPWSQQNNVLDTVPHQMQTSYNTTTWPQQNIATNQISQQRQSSHNPPGQHSEGITKFNKMFPGVKQGLGGDLGFDPMAIAIQMNPDNHLQTAMNTMNNVMNGNKGIDQMFKKSPEEPQSRFVGNTIKQSPPVINETVQQSAVTEQVAQGSINQMVHQQPHHNRITNQQNLMDGYGQQISQHQQQIYNTSASPNLVNQQEYEPYYQLADQQQSQCQQKLLRLNPGAPNLPASVEEAALENNLKPQIESTGYPNQSTPQQMLMEPILPVDTSKNIIYAPTKHQKNNNYGYNTLGQPIEMLPAKLYHPPEPTLPQTLSPQPDSVSPKTNPFKIANVKATISKTSLMGNRPTGKTPSRSELQHIYNQYKGSQSFTQQNVRRSGEGTCSDGRLNTTPPIKAQVPLERVGGDTIVSNPPANEGRINKVEQIMGQIGDVAVSKPAADTQPEKKSSDPIRKGRNGLQDMVFSSYPTSAAWTFHGHGRNDQSPVRRYVNRRY